MAKADKTTSKPPERARPLATAEWVACVSKVTGIAAGIPVIAAKSLSNDDSASQSSRQRVSYEMTRQFSKRLTPIQLQSINPSTKKVCKEFAKRHGVEHSELFLPESTYASWLGSTQASKVIVLFHGGGYMIPAIEEHVSIAYGLEKPKYKDVAVVVLQYSLVDENNNQYPRQLRQAVHLIEHLLQEKKLPPSAITLIGDSAGAHLTLGLFLHVRHPNPLVPPLDLKEDSFSGAVLVSPWVVLISSAKSLQENRYKDVLDAGALTNWAKNFLIGVDADPWNAPMSAPADWWSDLPVGDILVVYGEDEMLRDDIADFCEILKNGHEKAQIESFPGEVHEHMSINRYLKVKTTCKSGEMLKVWLNRHFEGNMEKEKTDA